MFSLVRTLGGIREMIVRTFQLPEILHKFQVHLYELLPGSLT